MPLHPQTASRDTGDRRLEARQLGVDSPDTAGGTTQGSDEGRQPHSTRLLGWRSPLATAGITAALDEESVLNFVMPTKL